MRLCGSLPLGGAAGWGTLEGDGAGDAPRRRRRVFVASCEAPPAALLVRQRESRAPQPGWLALAQGVTVFCLRMQQRGEVGARRHVCRRRRRRRWASPAGLSLGFTKLFLLN